MASALTSKSIVVAEVNKDFKLNGDNYEVWSVKIRYLLEEKDVLGSLSSVMAKPEEGLTSRHKSDLEAYVAWTKKNSIARIILLSAMDDEIAKQFHVYENAMDMWIALKHKFGGVVSLMKLRTLALKFDTYKMRYDHTMKMHLGEMANMMSELSDLGQKITEEQKVQAVIRSLPNSWNYDYMKMHLIRTESIRTFEDAARYLEVEDDSLTSIKTSVETHFSGTASVENSSYRKQDEDPKKPKQEHGQVYDKELDQEPKKPKQKQEHENDKEQAREPEKPKQKQEEDYDKEKAREPKNTKRENEQDYNKGQAREPKMMKHDLEQEQEHGVWEPSKKKQKQNPSRRRCLICCRKGHFATECTVSDWSFDN